MPETLVVGVGFFVDSRPGVGLRRELGRWLELAILAKQVLESLGHRAIPPQKSGNPNLPATSLATT